MDLAAMFEHLPDDRAELWSRLEALSSAWFGPLTREDGVPEEEVRAAEMRLGLPLPAALREAYLRFGRKEELTIGNELLLAPSQICVDEELLVFYAEEPDMNAPVGAPEPYRWGVRREDLSQDDPPVFAIVRRGSPPVRTVHSGLATLPTVSRFFACMALFVVENAAPYRASIDEDCERALAVAAQQFTRLDFPDAPYPPAPAHLLGGDDVVLVLHESVHVGAASPRAFARAVKAFEEVRWKPPTVEDAHCGPYKQTRADGAWVDLLLRAAARGGMAPPSKT